MAREIVEIDVEMDPEPSRLITCPDCGAQISPAAPACPRCGRPAYVAARAAPAPMGAHRVKKIDTLGGGCLVQGLGALAGGGFIVLGFVARNPVGAIGSFFLGLIVVLTGLVLGRRLSTRWTCGACGNPIAGRDVQLCPTCKAGLS